MLRIEDGGIIVTIDPAFGNNAFSMTAGGWEVLYTPPDWRTKPALGGIPLLAPWANRIDGDGYNANGRRFLFNPQLGNLRYDANHLPIHGLLLFTNCWQTIRQDVRSVTSRLEFWRFPEWMAQFPFAHTLEVTHRVLDGALEIETAIENLSEEPMPLCIGYHPYLQLTDSPRDTWKVSIAAREQVTLSEKLIPTGETQPVPFENPLPLAGHAFDTVFTNLTGAEFVVEGRRQRIAVRYGPKFPVAVVYAPANGSFVCFEPMTALTNAFNGKIPPPQIAPGDTWRDSFSVRPDGY